MNHMLTKQHTKIDLLCQNNPNEHAMLTKQHTKIGLLCQNNPNEHAY